MLAQLADGLDKERKIRAVMVPWKGAKAHSKDPRFISFIRQGEKADKENGGTGILGTAEDWEMRADLGRQLKFPEESLPASDPTLCSGPRTQSKWSWWS